jgi:hypothetical protein
MKEFALHLPINNVSFGQVSVSILREIHSRGITPCLFPMGKNDLSSQKIEPEFGNWLNQCLAKGLTQHNRKVPVIKLWHLNGSMESVSEKQILFTFYELDNPTQAELNIVKNNSRVIFSNQSTTKLFEEFGAENITTIPLGFDKHNFRQTNKEYFTDGRIVFNLLGKFEKRKQHTKIIKAWAAKFGNNPKYVLQCAVYNLFFKPEDNANLFTQALEGKRYFNIQHFGHMAQNDVYNDFLNSANIVIGMSGAEAWSLGDFQSVALGKHAVILNAHAYKDWANKQNAVLVNPCGKEEVYDGCFFEKGQPFNQGNIFTFNDDEFIAACEEAIKRVQTNPINNEGLKLQEKFTYAENVNKLLGELDKI